MRNGNDSGAYYHELFRRDQPSLFRQMVRKRIKGNGARAAADAESEPNFYSLQSSEFAIQSSADHGRFAALGTGLENASKLPPKPHLQHQSMEGLNCTKTNNTILVSLRILFFLN